MFNATVAAKAALIAGAKPEGIANGLSSFEPIEHRLVSGRFYRAGKAKFFICLAR